MSTTRERQERNDITKSKRASALAGNRTRVNCLEGSYANHYTTNAQLKAIGRKIR